MIKCNDDGRLKRIIPGFQDMIPPFEIKPEISRPTIPDKYVA